MLLKLLLFLLCILQFLILVYIRLEFNSFRSNLKLVSAVVSKNCSDLVTNYIVRFSKKG